MKLCRPHCLTILLVALLVRFLLSGVDMRVWIDSEAYILCAKALLNGNWPAYFIERPPGFPILLLPLVAFNEWLQTGSDVWVHQAVGVLNAMMISFTALLSADVAVRLFRKQALGLITGLAVALSPSILFYEHSVLSESLYALSQMLCLWYWIRIHKHPAPGQLALLGLLSGWLIWVRPIGFAFVAASSWVIWQSQRKLRALTMYLLPVLAFVLVWTAFQIQAHQYIGFIPSGGLNQLYKTIDFIRMDTPLHADFKKVLNQRRLLYPEYQTFEAVNDAHILRSRAAAQVKPYDQLYLRDDQAAREISLEAMLAHPLRYLGVTLREFRNICLLPNPWDPHRLSWFPILILGITGSVLLWQRFVYRFNGRLLVLGFWGQLLLYAILSVCTDRYRAPLEPLVIIIAVYAFSRLCLLSRQTLNTPPA